jgi:predicted metal-dependent phosphotriesterase family hydrolase
MADVNGTRFTRRQALQILGAAGGACATGSLAGEASGLAQGTGWLTARTRSRVTFPKGAIVRTVLKDVDPEVLASGATAWHEHVARAYTSPPAPNTPGSAPAPLAGSVDLVAEELRQAAFDGLTAIVDANASGRSARTDEHVDFLKKVAASVPKVQVLVAGGPFKAPYAPEVVKQSVEELTEQLVRDAAAQRWGAMGEIGTSMEMTTDERKVLTAIARAHVRTGVPIFSHTEHEGCPKCALDQLDLFESQGVDLKHLVIGHLTDIKPGSEPLAQTAKAIAKRGAFLGFDTVGHQMAASMNPEAGKVRYVLEVLNAGYEDNLMLSADFTQSPQLKANWGNGFSTVLVQFVPKLRYAGVNDATLRKILVENPRRFLSFVPKTT